MGTARIGLKRGTVRLVEHQPGWKAMFARERKRILPRVRKWTADVHHVGSTSIPGMPAKPVIDMLAVVRSERAARALARELVGRGYIYRGLRSAGAWLCVRGTERRRTRHFHIECARRRDWHEMLIFRDWMRRHPAQARSYAKLKRRLAREFPGERKRYTDGKKRFVKEVMRRIRRRWSVRGYRSRFKPVPGAGGC